MTVLEMTEIFSAMLLAWPNAEMFKGGISQLEPTIKFWAVCTAPMDYWTGQQAIIRLCRTHKFPPTIAEFREQAEAVSKDVRALISRTIQEIRGAELMYGTLPAFYAALPQGNFTKAVIDAIGGPDALVLTFNRDGKTTSMWNIHGIENACRTVIHGSSALIGGNLPVKTGTKRKDGR